MMEPRLYRLRSRFWMHTTIKRKEIMRIKCYCDLYVSDGLQKKKQKVIRKLMERTLQPTLYVLTLAQGEQNHLEFFPAYLLQQPMYDDELIFVVGIAEGYDAAMYLVEEIAQEVLSQTEGTDIRQFLLKRQREFEERQA